PASACTGPWASNRSARTGGSAGSTAPGTTWPGPSAPSAPATTRRPSHGSSPSADWAVRWLTRSGRSHSVIGRSLLVLGTEGCDDAPTDDHRRHLPGRRLAGR